MKAIWKERVIADSDDTIVVEGNHYFPSDSVSTDYIRASDTRTSCPWKGEAHYFDVVVDGDVNSDAAWFYPETKTAADNIRGRVAFWRGVEVVD